jgi:hypothetical protein
MSTNSNVSVAADAAFHMRGGLGSAETPPSSLAESGSPAPNSEEAESRTDRDAPGSSSRRAVRSASRDQNRESSPAGRTSKRQATDNKHKKAEYPKWLRQFVFDRAKHLHTIGDGREKSAVIAKDLRNRGHKGFSEADIDNILVGVAMEHERRFAAITVAIANGRMMADEAGDGVWSDSWPSDQECAA